MVESLLAPEALARMKPVVADVSWQLMRMFPAGVAKYPERDKVVVAVFAKFPVLPEAITVVPSHSLQLNAAVTPVSASETVPLANQVPVAPCAAEGPSMKLAVLFIATSAASELVRVDNDTEQVPLDVIVPPERPVPQVTEVTVPRPAAVHAGTPREDSERICVPVVFPVSFVQVVPFQ